MTVQFLGPHLYDRSLSCQFESGPHLYNRSSLCHVSSVRVRGRTYIDRPSSYQFSSSRDRTYIDRSSPYHLSCHVCLSRGRTHIYRPFPYQFVFSLSRDRTHIDRSFILPVRSVRRPGLCFSMTFRVTFPFWAFRVTFLT